MKNLLPKKSQCYNTHTGCYFRLSSGGETVAVPFTARQFPKLPSELIFVQSVLKIMRLSSLASDIVCINKRVTYMTKQVLTSKHDCVFDIDITFAWETSNSMSFTQSCSEHNLCDDFPVSTLFWTKRTHRVLKESQCRFKLLVKEGPVSSKSQSVNKIS